jgi:hypothetical protein
MGNGSRASAGWGFTLDRVDRAPLVHDRDPKPRSAAVLDERRQPKERGIASALPAL